eukprot:1026810-Alexandrium_andersonii.AAC.1
MGTRPITNREVLARSKQPPFVCHLRYLQLGYFGHVLRRKPWGPIRSIVFDRFLGPRVLAGTRRPGVPRPSWGENADQEGVNDPSFDGIKHFPVEFPGQAKVL